MAKLNENNSRFAVVSTAFHGGGTISFHNSLNQAFKSVNENTSETCNCGCCGIVPITEDAKNEMLELCDDNGERIWSEDELLLYSEIPEYEANGEHYSKLCK